ncbi:hypothetical protein HYPSUDRAFT_203659 [Hypholoma sublateritium FD-334 SS-4]|uniref:N-acetyltransferase domain-containing protein n=1 Tax=Hypholoma sublateritium (strain FD-334 SS-4) TaxID=945553 RepID=A0A0D2NNX3_HYPSF|nr:hypothetical protein HYPSUDRAFT_203659 [Hypholoma sublateritium FD-334 SS-4]
MFETDRLILREYRSTDEPFFLDLFNCYDVFVNLTMDYVAPSNERSREQIARLLTAALFVVAESKDTGALLGMAEISINTPQNLNGQLGIALAKDWWGKGFGTEIMEWLIAYSFKSLGLRRLTLGVFASNPGAVALYEHVGFKHEGRQREALWKEGKWVDMIWMGLLSREYHISNDPPDVPESLATDGFRVSATSTRNDTVPDWVVI